MIKYLKRNFLAFWAGWQMRLAQHRKYKQLKRKEKALGKAKKLADRRAAMDGRRHYVLPDWNGHYMVLNMREIKALKRAGIMSKQVTIHDLLNEAEYFTGNRR